MSQQHVAVQLATLGATQSAAACMLGGTGGDLKAGANIQSLSGVQAPPLLPSSQEDGHILQHEPFEGDIRRWIVATVRINPSRHFGGAPAQKHFLQRWGVQVRQGGSNKHRQRVNQATHPACWQTVAQPNGDYLQWCWNLGGMPEGNSCRAPVPEHTHLPPIQQVLQRKCSASCMISTAH